MRAVQVTAHGAPLEVVAVREIDVPAVGPGEVLVAVGAASLNFGDIARTRGGVASVQGKPPFTLGMDVCGVVEACGEGTEHLLGRRVVATTKGSLGGMAERAVCPATGVFDAPSSLSDVAAAGFFLPFHTSYLALKRRARLEAGETVLVAGGASAVGTAAIQVASALGATVIAAAGSEAKASYCRSQGAREAVDYVASDLFDEVMRLTDGRGADVVFDVVGGDLTERLWTCTAREGRYVPVGFNSDPQSGLTGRPLRKVSTGNISVVGVMLSYGGGSAMRKFGLNGFDHQVGEEVHAGLSELLAAGAIAPGVGRVVAMPAVAQALDDHENRRTMGRTVVDIAASGAN